VKAFSRRLAMTEASNRTEDLLFQAHCKAG
jgi:hypothetical protein